MRLVQFLWPVTTYSSPSLAAKVVMSVSVGTRIGFGDRERLQSQIAAGDLGQVALFLRFATVPQ